MDLFLDDDVHRISRFSQFMENPTAVVTTAETAIALLSDGTSWDTVHLDHDLGGEIYVDSARHDTGMEVVRYILEHKPKIKNIIVHTHNPVGRIMETDLKKAGYDTVWIPFNK